MAINLIIYASHVFFGLGQAYDTGGSGPTLTTRIQMRAALCGASSNALPLGTVPRPKGPGGPPPRLFFGYFGRRFSGLPSNRGCRARPCAPALSTKMILAELIQMEEAPWGDMRGKPLDSRGLAEEYGVASKTVRIGNATAKGSARV
jgi:hypothetical protein